MTVFVDTSAIVALPSAADAHHDEAVRHWTRLTSDGAPLITTEMVFAETVVTAHARAGFDVSVRAGERLMAPPFEMTWVDQRLLDEAWLLYRKYRDHELSLCDCVSFATMHRRRIAVAFAFDNDFDAVGFRRLRG